MTAGVAALARRLELLGLRDPAPFARPELVAEALTHSSLATEKGLRHNERLEMLGDSVLGFLVAELLFDLLPQAPEGVLTRMRASLVDEPSLAGRARQLELGAVVALGRGEEMSGGRDRDSLLADAFEAVLAAVYRSEGLEAARRLVRGLFEEDARRRAAEGPQATDFKTALQVRAQAAGLTPRYRITSAHGPDHDRQFRAEVLLGALVAGQGGGRTKKLAEQQAAKEALEAWASLAPRLGAEAASVASSGRSE